NNQKSILINLILGVWRLTKSPMDAASSSIPSGVHMKSLLIVVVLSVAVPTFAQESNQAQSSNQVANTPKACLAVKSAGSHAFRNIMLGGAVGAMLSKEQYEVLDVMNYPAAKIGD